MVPPRNSSLGLASNRGDFYLGANMDKLQPLRMTDLEADIANIFDMRKAPEGFEQLFDCLVHGEFLAPEDWGSQ